MQDETEGRVVEYHVGLEDTCEGDLFEIRLKLDDIVSMKERNHNKQIE